MTYTEIVRTVRIERFTRLLTNTTMTVANIAEAIGYDTPEHYIRQFKKHTGITLLHFESKPQRTDVFKYEKEELPLTLASISSSFISFLSLIQLIQLLL